MRWIYDDCGNADLEEAAFAEKGVSTILEHVDLSYAPRDAATCLLGRLVRELAETTGAHGNVGDDEPTRCEDAPIVATDLDEKVLIAVISAYEEGSARMPELSVSAAEFEIMRHACLPYLADHGNVDAIRHGVVSIVVAEERQAKLRHLIGAWQWPESRE